MLIKLSPFVPLPGDGVEMRVSARGDTLTVNGVEFDFSPLTEGVSYLARRPVRPGLRE